MTAVSVFMSSAGIPGSFYRTIIATGTGNIPGIVGIPGTVRRFGVLFNEIQDFPHGQIPDIIGCDGRIQLLESEKCLIFAKRHAAFVGVVHFCHIPGMAPDIFLIRDAGLHIFQNRAALRFGFPGNGQRHDGVTGEIAFNRLVFKKLFDGVLVIQKTDIQGSGESSPVIIISLHGNNAVKAVHPKFKRRIDVDSGTQSEICPLCQHNFSDGLCRYGGPYPHTDPLLFLLPPRFA